MTAAAKLQQFFELEPQNSQEKEKHPPKKYQNTTITSYSETGKPPESVFKSRRSRRYNVYFEPQMKQILTDFSISIHAIYGFTAETAKTKTKAFQRKRKQSSG